ncbi:MAG: M50 family metallopeptidase [Gordonia sp. (in: high G+C Gram-positive bacteria)]
MAFAIGAIVFALGLLASIAWHECGHMWAAQATGMKVRRYFVGFGPTLWSVRRGETEYGIKALPLGGFCDIAGMTPHEDLAPDEQRRAMFRQQAWKRLLVLFAGPAQNFVLGFVLIVVAGLAWGLPDLSPPPTGTTVAQVGCVTSSITVGADDSVTEQPCSGTGPAGAAGLLAGDRIVAVDGTPVDRSAELTPRIQQSTGPVSLTVRRGDREFTTTMTPQPLTITTTDQNGKVTRESINRVGITFEVPPAWKHYDAVSILPGSVVFTAELAGRTWDALLAMPTKVHSLWIAVTGGERAADTPISVYGATVLGGQAAERGLWGTFLLLLISINFFLGLFNLVPLLPLDGGHMAIVGYEKVRDLFRRLFGRAPGGPVDYYKLLPATYAVVLVMGAFMVLTLAADIVNPIPIPN